MDLIKNLKHMCRICAVNMKKRRSQNSAVSVFDTPQLKDKLRKYLNIDVSNNDELPKCICSICYKKVESIHALAALAKKTENFLMDFIKIAQANLKDAQATFPSEFQSLTMLVSNDDDDLNYSSNSNTMQTSEQTSTTKNLSTLSSKNLESEQKPEEVVLNFTLNDPLTKDIQKKIVVAKQKQMLEKCIKSSSKNRLSSGNNIRLNEEVEISPLKPISDAYDLIKEISIGLVDQKRQNSKVVLSGNNTQPVALTTMTTKPQHKSSLSPSNTNTGNYDINVSAVPSTSIGAVSQPNAFNIALQIQQQNKHLSGIFSQQIAEPPPAHIQPVQEPLNISKDAIVHAHLSSNANNPAFVKESMNLGSVIKDMDLLKLILKALKWPYNQDTLWVQIQRLKNTRFRDVMIDPNLLQDTDLMQILSSYLSPILLQQHQAQISSIPLTSITSPSSSISAQQPSPSLSPSAMNILPPSVSYKIPAETSVRLVSVPRDEPVKSPCNLSESQEVVTLELQQSHDNSSKPLVDIKQLKKAKQHRRHHYSSVIQPNVQYNSSKNKETPVIVLSDDEEPSVNQQGLVTAGSLALTKKEGLTTFDYAPKVDLSMMQNFDSSTEVIKAINKSLSLYHQSRAALNAEVTIQQRKKQKRKQSLSRIELQKNFNDQEIVIIDEHGEQPFKLSNEVSVVPKSSASVASTIVSTSSSSLSISKKQDTIQKPAKLKFDFLLPPKKKRKLQNFETCKSSEKQQISPNNTKICSTASDVVLYANKQHNNSNNQMQNIVAEDVSIERIHSAEIRNNKSNKNSTISSDINKQQDISHKNEIKPQIINVQIIEPISDMKLILKNNSDSNKVLSNEVINTTEIKKALHNDEGFDVESDDDGGLVIDENYEEKCKDEELKMENVKEVERNLQDKTPQKCDEDQRKTPIVSVTSKDARENEKCDQNDTDKPSVIKVLHTESVKQQRIEVRESFKPEKFEDKQIQEKLPEEEKKGKSVINVKSNKSNTSTKIVSEDKETPRRTTRNRKETKLPTIISKKTKVIKETRKTTANPKSSSTPTVQSSRIKTRHSEEIKKMQTRNSNISQRGREQKPSTKYNNKSTLRKRI